MTQAPEDVHKRVEHAFEDRKHYETLWETAYEYIAPERAVFFRKNDRSPNEVGDSVFDSTAIDAAERLANLIQARLIPSQRRWARMTPGANVDDAGEREALRGPLADMERRLFAFLQQTNLYQEVQPLLLDRIIGGLGTLMVTEDRVNDTLHFRNIPLSEVAVQEDAGGEVSLVVRKAKWSIRDVEGHFGEGKVPDTVKQRAGGKKDSRDLTVYQVNSRTVTGEWDFHAYLEHERTQLFHDVQPFPRLLATRWAKVPGSAYGRGPGLRALADVRALNKVKEMSLLNAGKAIAGAYTVVDDGVVNPYTLSMEAGSFNPVASNDINNPTIREFPQSGNFDVSMFQMDNLKASIREVFLADQFGQPERTPRSATEVAERTSITAQELGTTVSRLQHELLLPLLRLVAAWMGEKELLPKLPLDGNILDVEFVSQLARAQWMEDAENIVEFAMTAGQFGQMDPKAGMVLDGVAALRQLAEIRGVPPSITRTEEQIQALMEQGAENQVAMEEVAEEQMGP